MLTSNQDDSELRMLVQRLISSSPPAPAFEEILRTGPSDQSSRVASHRIKRDLTSRQTLLTNRKFQLAAALLVVGGVATTVTVASLSRPNSDAMVLMRFQQASALDAKAGSIHIEETVTDQLRGPTGNYFQLGGLTGHFSTIVDTKSGISKTTAVVATYLYLTQISTKTTGFVRYTNSLTTPLNTPSWYRYPITPVSHPTPPAPGSPGQLLGIEGPIKSIGTRQIGGVKSTGYAATVNIKKLIAETRTQTGRNTDRVDYLDQGVTSFPVRIWLDSRGRVRELSWQVRLPNTANVNVATEVLSYGANPVAISTPPLSDSTDKGTFVAAQRYAVEHPYTKAS